MAKSAVTHALSRFKQLACLGLGGEAVMPALIRELHTLVPCMRSMFFFADDAGRLANVYTESVEHARITQLYVNEFHGRRDRDIPNFSFAEAMRNQVGVHDLESLRVDEGAFRRTDFYNLLFRPVGRGSNYIRLVMRDRGRGLGLITVFRAPGDNHFDDIEKRRLAALEPFFVHALKDNGATEAPLVDSGDSGIIVADQTGKPKYFSAAGRRLLFRAMHPLIAANGGRIQWAVLPPPLRRLCQDLDRVFSESDIAAPPTYHHRNILGGFTFRAHWLDAADPGSSLVAITVSHQEPLQVKVVRRVGELALSSRQAEMCVLMASGISNDAIAERLGISRHTAIAHGRWIYNKLDVHNRAELVNKLLLA
jgi:DNA-binding CsgD family transcriptional regulator